MLYLILTALAAVIALWVFVPQFRTFIDGIKTHAIAVILWLSGAVTVLEPTMLSAALGLDARGQAMLLVGIGLLLHVARMLTKKPGKLAK